MHLNTEIAFDLMEGRLEQILTQQWAKHLLSCNPCSEEMDQWSSLRVALKRPNLQNAPASMLNSAVALFQPAAKTEQRSRIRQVIASLAFDSFTQPAFAGARGQTATRQVVL